MRRTRVRLYPERTPSHTYVKVFAGIGEENATVGKCGDLCFRNEEWEQVSRFLRGESSDVQVTIAEPYVETSIS